MKDHTFIGQGYCIDSEVMSDWAFLRKYMEILGGRPLEAKSLMRSGSGENEANYIDYDYVELLHRDMKHRIQTGSVQLNRIHSSLLQQADQCHHKQQLIYQTTKQTSL